LINNKLHLRKRVSEISKAFHSFLNMNFNGRGPTVSARHNLVINVVMDFDEISAIGELGSGREG
jgi:hypothetical protein